MGLFMERPVTSFRNEHKVEIIMGKKVTIVTLVYNVEKYFERSLKSIFEQDYENIEFLIVNNCSTDDSMGVLERTSMRYPNRMSQIVIQNNEKNMGYCYSINKGFELASGDYITFVDSDDWLEPGSISKCVSLMEKGGYDILQFENFKDTYQGRIVNKNRVKEQPTNIDCINAMLTSNYIMEGTFWTKFYRADFVKKSSLSLALDCPPWSDMCFNVRLFALTNKIGILREPLYHYCENESQTVKTWGKNRKASSLRVEQEVKNLQQVESHLRENGILNDCLEALNIRKSLFKDDNLLFIDKESIESWINTFPEINELIATSTSIPLFKRLKNRTLLSRKVNTFKLLHLAERVVRRIKRLIC